MNRRVFGRYLRIQMDEWSENLWMFELWVFFHDDQNIYLILEYAADGEVYQEMKSSVW